MYYRFRINNQNTQWIFILTSSIKPEDRHLNDIRFGLTVILSKGVSLNNITLIVDDDKSNVVQKLAPLITDDVPIYKSSDIGTVLSRIDKRFIVITITGHGSISGIDATPVIKPYNFIKTLKQNSETKAVFLLLGQCYAGIFNYMNVQRHTLKDNIRTPEIVIVGATGLSESISLPVEYYNISWHANIMIVAFFLWILSPQDIDGDGRFSFIDAFKFVVYTINQHCYQLEKAEHIASLWLLKDYEALITAIQSKPETELSLQEQIDKQAMEERLLQNYTHQEPWILNAKPAIQTDICL